MIQNNTKRWINTRVEYQWSDELGKLVQLAKEGYWYEGEMALAEVLHTSWPVHMQKSGGDVFFHTEKTGSMNHYWGYNGSSILVIAENTNLSTSLRFSMNTSGNVGIADGNASYKLQVAGSFYSSGSSIEYKQDVKPYTPPEGAIMSLKPIQYQYKDEWKDFGKRYAGNSNKQLGLVAEDVAKVLPELAVTKTENGKEVVRNVDYEKLTVLLVSEVQKLRTELDEIKNN